MEVLRNLAMMLAYVAATTLTLFMTMHSFTVMVQTERFSGATIVVLFGLFMTVRLGMTALTWGWQALMLIWNSDTPRH